MFGIEGWNGGCLKRGLPKFRISRVKKESSGGERGRLRLSRWVQEKTARTFLTRCNVEHFPYVFVARRR